MSATSFWTGVLVGAIVGVVLTVGMEVAVACLAYAGYQALIRMGLIKVETVVDFEAIVMKPEGK
jgi:hypothetical protein